MLFNLVLILIIIFLFFVLSMVWPPDSPWAPWWRTSKKVARAQCRLAKIKKGDLIYDLGSGDGTALMIAAKEFGAKGIGLEIDLIRFYISKLLLKLYGVSEEVKVKRKNFFEENLKNADIIFVYLVPKTLDRLIPKFKKELKKGTKILSYRYEINLPLKKYDKKNKIRLYII